MKDLYNHIEVESPHKFVTMSDDRAVDDIDLAGYNSATIVIACDDSGTVDDNTNEIEIKLEHGDTAGGDRDDVEAKDLIGSSSVTDGVLQDVSLTEQNQVVKFGYVGGKRYLKLTIEEGADDSVQASSYVIKGHSLDSPTIS